MDELMFDSLIISLCPMDSGFSWSGFSDPPSPRNLDLEQHLPLIHSKQPTRNAISATPIPAPNILQIEKLDIAKVHSSYTCN